MDTQTLKYMAERVDKGRSILGDIADVERRAEALREQGGVIRIETNSWSYHPFVDQNELRKFILSQYTQKIEKLKRELAEL